MNALFNALQRTLFPSKSARTLTLLIFAKNMRNNYAVRNTSAAADITTVVITTLLVASYNYILFQHMYS